MDTILGGLNPAQREAVETLEGPLLILAGAGSGKTKVLTHRIANLILHGVRPGQILAVTFTNKAATEMRTRLWRLLAQQRENAIGRQDLELKTSSFSAVLGESPATFADTPPRSFMPYMGTFHSICVRILRIEADAAGLDRNFTIYDSDDQLALIRRIIRTEKMTSDKRFTPKFAHSMISGWQTTGITPEAAKSEALYPNQKQAADVFALYEREKAAASALDFDDLLTRTARLFRENAVVRAKWQNRFRHILIDEYQDTNAVQYQLVKFLVNSDQNICVVGDDWQSIYSWRGADFTNILNFEKDFPGAKVIKLEQNYRSTGNILSASQKIINFNKQRSEKTLFTEAGKGDPVIIEGLADETGEANYVAHEILRNHPQHPFSDFAVLYRTNAQSSAFEKAFIDQRIPYKIIGGVRFYDRKEVKDVLAILKLLVNPHDRVSFERITKNVLSGVGQASLEKIFAYFNLHPDASFREAVTALSGRAKTSISRLANFLETYGPKVPRQALSEAPEPAEASKSPESVKSPTTIAASESSQPVSVESASITESAEASSVASDVSSASDNFVINFPADLQAPAESADPETSTESSSTSLEITPAELIEQVVKYFDFASLVHSGTPDGDERMQNLEVLASNASVYESLDEFLADASLLSSADESNSSDSVTLMTLHAAKGLEFPIVFMVGLEEGLFPSSRCGESEETLEEERRLAYVGMTRAMQNLYLTFAGSRYTFSGRNYNTPSQFLLEIGYNPYGSGSFGESGAYDADQTVSDVDFISPGSGPDFGILGGDPDGEFGGSGSGFDPFPEDVPVYEG